MDTLAVDHVCGPRVAPTSRADVVKDDLDAYACAAAAGDRSAVVHVLQQLLPRVRNLVRYLIAGDADVDDFAQESMIAVVRGLHSFRGDGPFHGWADRVVARSVFKQLSKRKQRREHVVPLELVTAERAVAPDRGPDQVVADRQAVTLLDQLPLEQRHALVLKEVLGMTAKEIAEQTGVPLETVRSRLKLSRARFLALLEEPMR